MKTSVVIPARLGSTRMPRKVLADLGGKPVLRHTWDRARSIGLVDEVVIATDCKEIAALVESWGGKAVMTDPACRCGTERIASILDQLVGDFILNVQADEVFIEPKLLEALIQEGAKKEADLVTPIFKIERTEELFNPNLVKVVTTHTGQAIYFSRSTIPYVRGEAPENWLSKSTFYGHVGVYAYQRPLLEAYASLPHSDLEALESLEQLRFIEAGYKIQTLITGYHSIAIDTQEDLDQASKLLANPALV